MEPIRTLFERDEKKAEPLLPARLHIPYGGDLRFPPAAAERLYTVANFVSTLDGVVTFDIPGQSGGGQISGGNDADRFIMGLLRASADAVIVGAGTANAVASKHLWTAEYIYPAAKDAYTCYRREILKKPRYPLAVIVTGRGHLDLNHSLFRTSGIEVLILTSAIGRDRLLRGGADKLSSTQIRELPSVGAGIDPPQIVRLLADEFRVKVLLHEGGPTLLGGFVESGLVDELFLTLAPQIAGRTPEHQRLGLVAHAQFVPSTAPWLDLVSAKQQFSHLYLRYRNSHS